MMIKIADDVYFVGAMHWDRRLFDELIPLPEGTSYNSYLIRGKEKIALIDTVDPSKEEELIENIEKLGVEKIDYVISNHAEQDHSGALSRIIESYPMARIVTNEKCKQFLMDLLLIDEEKFITVNDGDELKLGGKTLKFIVAPWVHWPETMLTYLKEDGILFSCDLFGSHTATSDIFSTENVYNSAKRYYAEIMMPFRSKIKQHIEKIENLEIKMIAPSHGPIYKNPEFILNAYRDWISDNVKNEVVIAYVSMHGSVEKMVKYLIEVLIEKGINVKPFNLTVSDIGELAMALVDSATFVLATPTVLSGIHPLAFYALYLANALRPKTKFVSIIGSYGWGSRIVEQAKEMLTAMKAEVIEPVMVKGQAKDDDYTAIKKLAEKIADRHKEIGILTL
ncbi:MAG TPA: FprA family A-type flavoprotein [Thermoplasmatales archaeon]|nr:FprA family A-type flavoprotein [Thermoplasmatales archaeon]